jgi:hypothetical protein
MRVTIHASVLNDSDSWNHLDEIIHYFDELRHAWQIDDYDEIEQSAWVQKDIHGRAGKRILATLMKCYTAAIYPAGSRCHSKVIEITLHASSATQLAPEEACYCLRLPSRVLVENVASDGEFLHFMIAAFKRHSLRDAHSAGWLTLDQLGGYGECEKRLNKLLEQTYGPARIFVLVDSDRLYPGHISQTILKVAESCQACGIPYAILTKRKIENYLPLNILQQVNTERYKAYLHLNPEQKDHYEMKKGFVRAANGNAIVPPEQTALYQHVPPKSMRDLCGGFGRDIAQQFEAHKSKVREEDVRMICSTNPIEIDEILNEIEAIL